MSSQYSVRFFQAQPPLPQIRVALDPPVSKVLFESPAPSQTDSQVSMNFSYLVMGFLQSGQLIFLPSIAAFSFFSDIFKYPCQ